MMPALEAGFVFGLAQTHLIHRVPLGDPTSNYWVLGFEVLFERFIFIIALREFLAIKSLDDTIWKAIRKSKDPTTFTVLFEGTAAVLGLIEAFPDIFSRALPL